jgi:hypothetical protein
VRWVRPSGGGPFHSYGLQAGVESRWTTDGRDLRRGGQAWLLSEFQLRSFVWFGCNAVFDADRWDVRELDQAGVALERPGDVYGECWASSDPSKPVFVEGGVGAARTLRQGPLAPVWFGGTSGKITVRPHPRLETRIDAKVEWNEWRARWVDTSADGATFLLADLAAPALSVTLRQLVVLTPRLTLQAYAQLFTSYGRYGQFWEATASAPGIRSSSLRPRGRPDGGDPRFAGDVSPEFRTGALSMNAVLRWEYRLGSTFFLVYTRSQAEPEWDGAGPAPPTLRPWELGVGPTTDTILIKWSHFLSG